MTFLFLATLFSSYSMKNVWCVCVCVFCECVALKSLNKCCCEWKSSGIVNTVMVIGHVKVQSSGTNFGLDAWDVRHRSQDRNNVVNEFLMGKRCKKKIFIQLDHFMHQNPIEIHDQLPFCRPFDAIAWECPIWHRSALEIIELPRCIASNPQPNETSETSTANERKHAKFPKFQSFCNICLKSNCSLYICSLPCTMRQSIRTPAWIVSLSTGYEFGPACIQHISIELNRRYLGLVNQPQSNWLSATHNRWLRSVPSFRW